MIDRDRFLRILNADHVAWAKRYGIEPAIAPCYLCGVELHTTIPFAVAQLRGLVAPDCACGNVSTPYCVVHQSLRMDDWLGMLGDAGNPRGIR